MTQTILIIGGSGAQGSAIVRALVQTGHFFIRVLTRSTTSDAAKELSDLGGVTLIEGDSSDVAALRSAFKGVDACYVNTNGFALGEKAEIYWGIRTFEIAREAGLKHYVWAGLPYVYKRSGYDPKYNTGHLDGKGRVNEFISAQSTSPMNWTIINSCLYLEMFYQSSAPSKTADGVYVFTSATGNGSAPMITLPDLALYTKWVFEHPEEARGMILDTATEHVSWANVVKSFTEVTGKKAIYNSMSIDEYMPLMGKMFKNGVGSKFGEDTSHGDPTLFKAVDNFRAFNEVHRRAVPPSQGLWPVDYARLDGILPGRVKSVKEWFVKEGFTGDERKGILKTAV